MGDIRKILKGFLIAMVIVAGAIPAVKSIVAQETTEDIKEEALASTITIKTEDQKVEKDDSTFDLLKDVTASDEQGNEYEVSILNDGGFDISIVGEYTLVYGVSDPTTNEVIKQERILSVVEVEKKENVVKKTTPTVLASSTVSSVEELYTALASPQEGDVITLADGFTSGNFLVTVPNVNITIDGNGNTWTTGTFTINGSGSGSVTLKNLKMDGSSGVRPLQLGHTSGQVILENLEIRNAKARALYISSGSSAKTTINNSVFADNTISSALYLEATANVDINYCTFENNSGNNGGYESGAISSKNYIGILNINNTVFKNNKNMSANTGIYGGGGGAIEIHYFAAPGQININDSYFNGNETAGSDVAAANTYDGGAIYVFDGKNGAVFNVNNTTFDSNIAHDDGGAIMLQSAGNFTTSITNCTFYNNVAQGLDGDGLSGGAIQYFYNNAGMTNSINSSTFVNNTAGNTSTTKVQKGGAVSFSGGGFAGGLAAALENGSTYNNSLFVGNQVYTVGGVLNETSINKDLSSLTPKPGTNLMNVTPNNTVADVLGINNVGLTTNYSTLTAGAEKMIVPTIPIKPEGLAENTSANEITGYDGRSDAHFKDIGAVESTWVKYDANGGTFGLSPLSAYNGSEYYEANNENLFATYYDVGFIGRTSSVKSESDVAISKPNYIFLGWSTDPTATVADSTYAQGAAITHVKENLTLYAVWELEEYDVTYNGNGHTSGIEPEDTLNSYQGNELVTVLDEGTLEKENWTFIAWNTKADGSGVSYNANDTFAITEDTTLYAQWDENDKFTVTYDGSGNSGGTVPVDAGSPYYANSNIIIMDKATLVRDGYRFVEWNTKADGSGIAYKPGDSFTVEDNIVLYAQWKKIPLVVPATPTQPDPVDPIEPVEPTKPATPDTPKTPSISGNDTPSDKAVDVETGDLTNTQNLLFLVMVSIGLLGGVMAMQRKRKLNK